MLLVVDSAGGLGAAHRSNSYVASGCFVTHERNGAYSRADATCGHFAASQNARRCLSLLLLLWWQLLWVDRSCTRIAGQDAINVDEGRMAAVDDV